MDAPEAFLPFLSLSLTQGNKDADANHPRLYACSCISFPLPSSLFSPPSVARIGNSHSKGADSDDGINVETNDFARCKYENTRS